jgi:hypothetical protein
VGLGQEDGAQEREDGEPGHQPEHRGESGEIRERAGRDHAGRSTDTEHGTQRGDDPWEPGRGEKLACQTECAREDSTGEALDDSSGQRASVPARVRAEGGDRTADEQQDESGNDQSTVAVLVPEPARDRGGDGGREHERGQQPGRAGRVGAELTGECGKHGDHDRLRQRHRERGDEQDRREWLRCRAVLGRTTTELPGEKGRGRRESGDYPHQTSPSTEVPVTSASRASAHAVASATSSVAKVGDPAGVVGFEVDGADHTVRNGLPEPTHADGTPDSLKILAMAPAVIDEAEMPMVRDMHAGRPPDHLRNPYGAAMIATFERGQGTVFNAGTAERVRGLIINDPYVDRITTNVLDHGTGAPVSSTR